MFIELVDALRCPNQHEESWLVVSATKLEERHIREGILGCPVCRSEYPVHEGVADFRRDLTIDAATASPLPVALVRAEQLAAVMNLADPLGFAILIGGWSIRATELLALVDSPPLILVDPPASVAMRPGLSGIRCDLPLPLAAGATRAVAVDSANEIRLASAIHATRVGGRIVAPASAALPDGVRELARDQTIWVAARESAPSDLVTLHVRRG